MRSPALFVALSLIAASAAAVHASTLYGVAQPGSGQVCSLYAVDASTGAAELIGSTGRTSLRGLALNTATNELVAIDGNGAIFALDRTTGAASPRATAFLTLVEGGFEYDPAVNRYYANSGGGTPALWSIKPDAASTADRFKVGDLGLPGSSDVSGLAIDDVGVLYGYATNQVGFHDSLVTISTQNGAASTVGSMQIDSATGTGGMAFDNGTYYVSHGRTLWTVDRSLGTATLVGSHNFGTMQMVGLAAPEPASLVLLLVAGVGLVRKRG